MALFIFIAKLFVSSGLLYGYYHLFLRNKRFHHYNRFYLLAVALLSFIIPFIHIPVSFFGGQQQTVLIKTLNVINANGWEEPVIIYARNNAWSKWITVQTGLYTVYIAGLLTGLVVLIRSLVWIMRLQRKYGYEVIDKLKIYNTNEAGTPFSFFKSIFWDEKISLHDNKGQQIFRHELFHVKEKHSADVLLVEIICCIGWFNPFFHLIRKEIRAIHEFLADDYAISANNRYDYAELLITHAIGQQAAGRLTNPFFHNQIKRRITMITQSNLIRRRGYISRMMALPLLFILVSAFAVKLTNKLPNGPAQHYANKTITVVIDAGHGGIYHGAHSSNNIVEKDITLSIAQKIKELGTNYNLNIVLTRNRDALVGNATNLREDLMNRVQLTTDAKADMFVSIHVNAFVTETDSKTGFEAYISPKKEDDNARVLASAILTGLKELYTVDETIQKRSVGVQVLDKNTCPSVMIECGYLTNKNDVAFITQPINQEKVARKILEGIVKYSNSQSAGTTTFLQGTINSDTLSAEELSKININDIKSVDTDLHTNITTVYLKNGDVKYAHVPAISKFYTANNITDTVPAEHGAHNSATDSASHTIFTKVEFEPDYVGGEKGWIAYLIKNVHYPKEAIAKKLEGTVVVEFIVDTNGKISDVKAISGPKELQAESMRVIKDSGTWVSAVQHGKKVKAYKRQPITYKLG